ncbi:hypothetical protein QBC34DRAFT_101207 [Podospora aff. communis PSN243]|uniref:Ubiquitin-like domain-containing protein n=1 Tax=Podospora aff. communis PSN243 TaxID=3040156 RepID=A0AAV9GL72_9PEZI|nr:hypothetical protein QBC34DRAFT_101207 [Podospora aff. communis PSN243]
MAEPLSIAASVVGVVSFGLRLATALQTYAEIASEADEALHDIIFDINATASALRQLSDLIESDKSAASEQGRPPIFKEAGEADIRSIALKLEKVYKTIVVLVQKATNSKTVNVISKNSDTVIDPSLIKPLASLSKAKWPWLAPRVDRCHTQLRWLKISLLVNLQIAHLGQLHLKTGPRAAGTFDQELALRSAAETLRHRQLSLARNMAARQEKEKSRKAGPASVASADKTSKASPVTESSERSMPPLNPPSAAHITNITPPTPTLPRSTLSPESRLLSSDSTAVGNPIGSSPEGVSTAFHAFSALASPGAPSEKRHETRAVQLPPQDKIQIDGTADSPKPDQAATLPEDPAAREPMAGPAPAPIQAIKDASPRLIPSFLSSWATSIFGSADKFLTDTQSDDLEAYMAEEGTADAPIKIPFGHQRLTFGLKRTLKAKRGSTWYEYVQMTPTQRHIVDQVMKYAKTQSRHVRTCLGLQQFKAGGKRPYYLIYLSLSEPPPPIYFTDCIGRNFKIPFEHCKTWDDMRSLIENSLLHVPSVSVEVRNGSYDLLSHNRELYYMPSSWSTLIRPGDKVRMEMRPPPIPSFISPRMAMLPPAPPVVYPPPRSVPHLPPGGFSAGWHQQQQRPRPGGGIGGGTGQGIINIRPRSQDGDVKFDFEMTGSDTSSEVALANTRGRRTKRRLSSQRILDVQPRSRSRGRTSRFRSDRRFSVFIRDDSESDADLDGMSEGEEDDVDVVDFAAESKEDGGVSDLLRRFTHIEDVTSEGIEEVRKAMEGMDTALEDESDSDSF